MSKLENSPLSIDDFVLFYRALNGNRNPFAWQCRLVEQVCTGTWPDFIKLPTSSGKTTTIDIAIFALAYQAAMANRSDGRLTAPRRMFFVVDRRIIVNEAYEHATAIAKQLRAVIAEEHPSAISAEHLPILRQTALWLQSLTADATAPPLDCFELRGGIYRNDAWVRSLLQPTILTTTVDQVGSRLLFRGYGVSDRNLPIHAALTANDSLIILDEAHCSKPFGQTMNAIKRYRGQNWCEQLIDSPFQFVQMTATPPVNLQGAAVFELQATDYEVDALLKQRHECVKPIELVMAANAKSSKPATVAKCLVEQAIRMATVFNLKKIAIVVNRVDIAREAYNMLAKLQPGNVHLMIGRMRPLDRDALTSKLQSQFRSGAAQLEESDSPQFVVATQCLEVGADLDFAAMVTQCASLDALRQRFGRLNRLGAWPRSRGVVVIADGDLVPTEKLEESKPDPIYGHALSLTWHWLNEVRSESVSNSVSEDAPTNRAVDFGICPMNTLVAKAGDIGPLLMPSENAPVLMPAHIDMLCQTSPRPMLEPDIATYLHGLNRGCAEVKVCWRADLDLSCIDDLEQNWISTVEICPPSSAECLAVPLHIFRKWLAGEKLVDNSSDVLGEHVVESEEKANDKSTKTGVVIPQGPVLVWRGKKTQDENQRGSFCVTGANPNRIAPNETIVIPVEYGGWHSLGHVPDAPPEPTLQPRQLYQLMIGSNQKSDDAEEACEARKLAKLDIADQAFLQSRAKTIFRAHPKLTASEDLEKLSRLIIAEAQTPEPNWSLTRWRDQKAQSIREEFESVQPIDLANRCVPSIVRLTQWLDGKIKAKILSYPVTDGRDVKSGLHGACWITECHSNLTESIPPLPTFGDDENDLTETGKLTLHQHLNDVVHEADRIVESMPLLQPYAETINRSAQYHDLGKADPRFQAMLLGKPLGVAYMQNELWAKSDLTAARTSIDLPFRHEMVSLSLVESFSQNKGGCESLMLHLIASHHGFARPFAPYRLDSDSTSIDLSKLGGPLITADERCKWIQPHRLDSGVAGRFWELNRKFGPWGLALLESALRLADWKASCKPRRSTLLPIDFASFTFEQSLETPIRKVSCIEWAGIDGSNPLAFLAAMGAFRTISLHLPDAGFQLQWMKSKGGWRPVLSSDALELSEDSVLKMLHQTLSILPEEHPAIRLASLVEKSGLRDCLLTNATNSTLCDRNDADWLSCNLSDIATKDDAISQLQTTRRDYHSINVMGLVRTTIVDHLFRSLFKTWDYADPIAGVSLHLEPREDRRYAYQWYMPSGDPTRGSSGGMIGANRLAIEAWPMFQSLPNGDKLKTVGFRGSRANDTYFTWPIWNTPIDFYTVQSVLSMIDVQAKDIDREKLSAIGIVALNRSQRILVGKTPNLTPARTVYHDDLPSSVVV